VQQGVELVQDEVVKEVQDETAKGAQEAKGAASSSLSALRLRYPGAMEKPEDQGEFYW
jgi:hypothetical protein